MEIIGGSLTPTQHDGKSSGMVYGVDAAGVYLGVVPIAQAATVVTSTPPRSGSWRWSAGAWVPHLSLEETLREIDVERDKRLMQGAQWGGRSWYTDQTFQQQVAAYLQAYSEGILPAAALSPVRSMDGTVNMLTRDEIRQIAGTVMAYVQGVWAWSWTAKAAARA
jgi:hypothetical protein